MAWSEGHRLPLHLVLLELLGTRLAQIWRSRAYPEKRSAVLEIRGSAEGHKGAFVARLRAQNAFPIDEVVVLSPDQRPALPIGRPMKGQGFFGFPKKRLNQDAEPFDVPVGLIIDDRALLDLQ